MSLEENVELMRRGSERFGTKAEPKLSTIFLRPMRSASTNLKWWRTSWTR